MIDGNYRRSQPWRLEPDLVVWLDLPAPSAMVAPGAPTVGARGAAARDQNLAAMSEATVNWVRLRSPREVRRWLRSI